MSYIKIDTETSETLEKNRNKPTKKTEEQPEISHPQPILQEITEEDLHQEDERRREREKNIIESLTAEELKEIMQRNQIQDLFRKKPEIGQA